MRSLPALAMTLVLLGPATAAHASGLSVIRDCTYDEVMSKTYTQREYRDALRELASDSDQYNNCRDVIRRAQSAALAGPRKPKSKGSDDGAGGGERDAVTATVAPGAIGSAPAAKQLDQATKLERSAVERARTVPERRRRDRQHGRRPGEGRHGPAGQPGLRPADPARRPARAAAGRNARARRCTHPTPCQRTARLRTLAVSAR